MKVNTRNSIFTNEGAPAVQVSTLHQLRRSVLACMLFEDNFYENGISVSDRIKELCAKLSREQVLNVALEAQAKKLRHMPLFLIVEAMKLPNNAKLTWMIIDYIITRADQITDLLALYWKDGKKPIPNQLKKGLASAFKKFDAYSLAKYNRDNAIKLRDVLFMVHAKPKDTIQAEDWKHLIDGTLAPPDTWEVRLSSGADKKQSFSELLLKGKMGKLAILRNLRNMKESGVPKETVLAQLLSNAKEMLPFQYLAAARECPEWEDMIDKAMIQASAQKHKLVGRTVLLVDVSGSMDHPLSAKSKMTRMDAACGLAILLRECCEDFHVATFSNNLVAVPPRQGMALRDAIVNSQFHSGTYLGQALNLVNIHSPAGGYDRLIVITDEQVHGPIPHMKRVAKNYILNIGCDKNGIGNQNQWTTISGFSEASIDFIRELESFESE